MAVAIATSITKLLTVFSSNSYKANAKPYNKDSDLFPEYKHETVLVLVTKWDIVGQKLSY